MKNRILLIFIVFFLFESIAHGGNSVFVNYKARIRLLTEKINHLQKLEDLNKYYSDKRLGSFCEDGKTFFRIFAPNAHQVLLITEEDPQADSQNEDVMKKDEDGVWEVVLDGEQYGLFYGFKVLKNDTEKADDAIICLDPYAKAVASYNTYMGTRRAIVVKEDDYDWEGDSWIQRDWRDATIYEMHVRDMTAHSTSGADKPGTYQGLIEKEKRGGISYIKELGVNTVELLPAQEFANIEIPWQKDFAGRYNTWNPYERNHWGYMTAAFFAPETYYSEGELLWDQWQGLTPQANTDFKDMVKAFHKENIAVMMDVVYNHISEYELGNFKEIDKEYYLRLDDEGNYIAESGCGNDFNTERPMARRLIIESVLYWMKEYHIDGFRFDLGKLIDWETIEEIIHEAKKINPHVIIVCEPWGGGYDPAGFSLRGWGSWNDQIRNGIKGENPKNGHGWIFGKWYGNNSRERIKSYVNGTLVRDTLGLFQKKEHAVNYLAAHDGYTLGDFIRVGTGEVNEDEVIENIDEMVKLSEHQLKLHKLGALFLFTSQGMTMIHSGQEFARTKVVPKDVEQPDDNRGKLNHNTYDKDNETNYINYDHAESNNILIEFYKGLFDLRGAYDAFRRADYESITFIEPEENEFALGYRLIHNDQDFLVLFNADPDMEQTYELPEGEWNILVNPESAGTEILGTVSGSHTLAPTTGYVLKK